jgi:hypothetical protein|tara:strand:- start:421 stop:633 length:213 start_codon:yes stop_codon:yes gene_type:complete
MQYIDTQFNTDRELVYSIYIIEQLEIANKYFKLVRTGSFLDKSSAQNEVAYINTCMPKLKARIVKEEKFF